MWEKELETAIQAAREAGAAIREVYDGAGELGIEYKVDERPLTVADKMANKVIVKRLREAWPEYAILSEEEKDDRQRLQNNYCFIVDPLDGTKEFIKRNGQFTVNIALAYRHRSVMGVIYAPVPGDLYFAAEGLGAWRVEKDNAKKPLHVSAITAIDEIRLVMSLSHGSAEMDALIKKYGFRHKRPMGSSLKGCLVAAGEAEVYYRFNPTMEWDTAAMQSIAEEAGAVFRQMDDSEMLYNREDSTNRKGFYVINDKRNRFR